MAGLLARYMISTFEHESCSSLCSCLSIGSESLLSDAVTLNSAALSPS